MAKKIRAETGRKVSGRISPRAFAALVSESDRGNELIQGLLDRC